MKRHIVYPLILMATVITGFLPGKLPAALAQTPAKAALSASPLPRLLVLPFDNRLKDRSAAIAESAVDILHFELLRGSDTALSLIDRRQIAAQLAELALAENALSDPRKALQLGKIMSAGLMLSGSVSSGKIHTSAVTNLAPTKYTWATVELRATLTETETGQVRYVGRASGSSQRYPSWQGNSYTSIICDAVENAAEQLARELRQQAPWR